MMRAFAQEASDFDRQMGCMAGMFQIFDRRRLLTARQRGGARGAAPPGSGTIPILLLCTLLRRVLFL